MHGLRYIELNISKDDEFWASGGNEFPNHGPRTENDLGVGVKGMENMTWRSLLMHLKLVNVESTSGVLGDRSYIGDPYNFGPIGVYTCHFIIRLGQRKKEQTVERWKCCMCHREMKEEKDIEPKILGINESWAY